MNQNKNSTLYFVIAIVAIIALNLYTISKLGELQNAVKILSESVANIAQIDR